MRFHDVHSSKYSLYVVDDKSVVNHVGLRDNVLSFIKFKAKILHVRLYVFSSKRRRLVYDVG